MRSRYTAYALGRAGYVSSTWHPSTRPASLTLDPAMRWTRLTILATGGGTAFDTTGTVRFTADWTTGRRKGSLTETSRFRAEGGRWFYVDGAVDDTGR